MHELVRHNRNDATFSEFGRKHLDEFRPRLAPNLISFMRIRRYLYRVFATKITEKEKSLVADLKSAVNYDTPLFGKLP